MGFIRFPAAAAPPPLTPPPSAPPAPQPLPLQAEWQGSYITCASMCLIKTHAKSAVVGICRPPGLDKAALRPKVCR